MEESDVNAWVYPKQQENVGVAKIAEADGVYTLSNNVLAASYNFKSVKVAFMLTDCHKVCKNLTGMSKIGKSVDYGN